MPGPVQHLLKVDASDHLPIQLSLQGPHAMAKPPFRFEDIWLQHSDSWDVVREAWARGLAANCSRSPFHRLRKCLFFVRQALGTWSRSQARCPTSSKGPKTILALQRKDMLTGLDESENAQLTSATSIYNGLLAQQEILLEAAIKTGVASSGSTCWHL